MIHLFQTILFIRCKQLWRVIRSVGWGLLILLLLTFGGIFLAMVDQLLKAPDLAWTLLLIVFLTSIHLSRNDLVFLKKLSLSPRLFYIIEYGSGILPVLIVMLLTGRWLDALLSVLVVPVLAFLPAGPRSLNVRKLRLSWIPIRAFEWRSGIRQRPYLLFLLYCLGWGTLFFSPLGYVVMLLLVALTGSGYYDFVESKDMIEAIYFPKRNLSAKVLNSLAVFHGLVLPYHITFLVLYFSYWYFALATMLMSSLLLIFSLYYKYAGYYPRRLRMYNQTPAGIFFMSMLVPFFWPGLLIYTLVKWRKAEKTLAQYFRGIE